MASLHLSKLGLQPKSFLMIFLGVLLYGVGYTAFILPEQIVVGGVTGISSLVYYVAEVNTGITIWVLNILLLLIAFRALTKQFVVRTLIGVSLLSLVVGLLQPVFAQFPLVTPGEDKFMHVLIGGSLSGAALGIIFANNGSTGGTDIVVALLNKYFRMSFGRAMQFIDITIICSSYLLFRSAETIVYGVAFTLVASVVCDYIINGTRQTVQFIIISKEYEAIANTINSEVHRGVTVIRAQGWYSKDEVNMLIVLTRKYESQEVFNYIKTIDPKALVSQSFCTGVFGEGFDKIK